MRSILTIGIELRGHRSFQRAGLLDHSFINRHIEMMLIYKIFRASEWDVLCQNGQTDGAPIDLDDGYIHLSGPDSVAQTAALYFADVQDLVLVAIEADTLTDLHWEPSRGGTLFPHLYRPLTMNDVVWHKPLPFVDGLHQFPVEL